MLRKLEGPPYNIRPAEEMLRKLWNLFLCLCCCINHHWNNSFSRFSPFHHKKMRQNHHHRFTHCYGCNPFQSRGWTMEFILAKNWNTKFKSPRFYGQNHQIAKNSWSKSPNHQVLLDSITKHKKHSPTPLLTKHHCWTYYKASLSFGTGVNNDA